MADVEHSALTGASLHEPKGADAAAANRVYVSDGVGSGSWTTVGLDVLADAAKAFEAELLHVVDAKSDNTDGGTFTSGAWQTRTLNTTRTNEITGASLSSNQITLPSGTYFIIASAPGFFVNAHQVRFRNTTDGSTTLLGTSAYTTNSGSDGIQTRSWVVGRFTIAAQKVFELQHRCQTTFANRGLGQSVDFDESEVYSDVMIWKVA